MSRMPKERIMVQVLEDEWTRNPEDAQKTFDLLASKDKELVWVKNTKKRFRDGYNYFGRHPEKVIAFFDKHMKAREVPREALRQAASQPAA